MTVTDLAERMRGDLKAGRAVTLQLVEEWAVASVPLNVEDDSAKSPTFSSGDARSVLLLIPDLVIENVYQLIEPAQLAVTLTDGQSDVDVWLELRPDDDQYTALGSEGLQDRDN